MAPFFGKSIVSSPRVGGADVFFVLLSLIVFGASAASAADRCALVVGVERYDPAELAPLEWAEDDAASVGAALESLGFNVITMTSKQETPSRWPISREAILLQLERLLAEREVSDTIVLLFSGHGLHRERDDGSPEGGTELYFCPERANPSAPETLLAMSVVQQLLHECQAERKLLIVDAGRGYWPAQSAKNTTSPRWPVPAAEIATIFSCQTGETAHEVNAFAHSVFTHHLLEYLKGNASQNRYPQDKVTVGELAIYVRTQTRETVLTRFNRLQVPDVTLPQGSFAEWSLGRRPTND